MGGSDGKKSNERKKSIGSRKINNSKITKLNYAGTKFFEGKIVADFSMVIISKKGKNIELNLNLQLLQIQMKNYLLLQMEESLK